MNILITGGCGFVGSNLAIHLTQSIEGVRVVCMDNLYRKGSELNVTRLERHGIKFARGDVRESSSFPDEKFDLLIECSAEPSVLAGQSGSPDYLVETNLMGLYRCLEKCRRDGSGILFLSTSRVYPVAPMENQPFEETATRFAWVKGNTRGIGPAGVAETLELTGARSLYGFTKLAGEQLIEEYRAAFGLRAVINRCGLIAGPWQFGKVDQGVVALWVMSHLFGRPLSYIGYGGLGKQVRDVLSVEDLCRLVEEQVRNFDAWEGWVGNVAGELTNSVSLCELTSMCREATGATVAIKPEPEPRPFDLRIFTADCAKLFARTAWRPQRSVPTVVQDVASWVSEHREVLQRML